VTGNKTSVFRKIHRVISKKIKLGKSQTGFTGYVGGRAVNGCSIIVGVLVEKGYSD
jgi:hypothetical protein